MRAKTGSYKPLIALPLILLFAVLLLCCLSAWLPVAQADDAIYLDADVTVGGEFLPSSLTYLGEAYDFDFRLYQSANKLTWQIDAADKSNFELKFYDRTGAPIAAPQAVGSYTVRVLAKDVLTGQHKNKEGTMISENVVVGEKSFSIAYEPLSLYCSDLDRVSALVLDDSHLNYYASLTGSVSLLLNGQTLTAGADYSFVVEKYDGAAYEEIGSISTVGTYRLKVTIDSSVDLSRTAAADVLDTDGLNHLLYREFTVTRAAVSIALTNASMYEGRTSAVTLTDESKTKLGTTIGVSYDTEMILTSSAEPAGRVVASQVGGALSHQPLEAGSYLYRVIFRSASAGYGIAVGDYLDLPFTLKPIPYSLSFRINNSSTNLLDYVVKNTSDTDIALAPYFRDLQGNALTSVYTSIGAMRYAVSYLRYNGGWEAIAAPHAAGKYQVVVTFTSDAEIESGYTITAGSTLTREFQVITAGSLSVAPLNGGVCYFTNAAVAPDLLFLSQAVEDAVALVDGKYVLSYYDSNGDPATPKEVGEYLYEVKFTSAVEELGVAENATYRGTFRIVYHTLAVSFGDEIAFTNGETEESVAASYDVSYFERLNGTYRALPSEPTLPGDYLIKLTFNADLVLYRIKSGDFVSKAYSIAGTTVECDISSATLDLVYDGGGKEPTLTFLNTVGDLVEYKDYMVTYFKDDLSCGKPTLAGSYRALVTFLVTDDDKGVKGGAYSTAIYTIAPRSVSVTFSVSGASADLVYDASNKTFDVTFTDYSRPIDYLCSVQYAVQAVSPAFGDDPYKNAGNYLVKATLTDDKSGSLILQGNEQNFTIEKLSLEVGFTVPLADKAMWTGAEVSPTVKYRAKNGKYAADAPRTEAEFGALGIAIGEAKSYFTAADGVHYEIAAGTPILTDTYLQTVSTDNQNLIFASAVSAGHNGSTVTVPTHTESTASQVFSIIPREVEIKVTFDAAMYYTGSTALDRKGVLSTAFAAFNGTSGEYDQAVADFDGDYDILYYSSDYKGTTSGEGSADKPTEKGYYVARVQMKGAVTDDYMTEHRYTFLNGKGAGGAELAGGAISAGSYVDFVFRIYPQSLLDVNYNLPATFAENGEAKVISVTFFNNFSEVDLQADDGVDEPEDYKITYHNEAGDAIGAPVDAGKYTMKVTFLKKNVAYRLGSYVGSLVKANDLYISEGDTLTYSFEIFEPRALTVALSAPASPYYDGTEKAFGVAFTVTEGGVDSFVTLTYGTHYKLVYYTLSGEKYEAISGAPTLPGSYAVEVVFLVNLPDYTIEVDGTPQAISTALVTTIKGAGGAYADAKTPRATYTVLRAKLVLGGLSAKDKVFDGTTTVTFTGTPTLSVKNGFGAMVKEAGVFPYTLTGSITGAFHSSLPGENGAAVAVDISTNYTLSEGADALYELEYPTYSAVITKSVVKVTPSDVKREYNPFAVDSLISYALTYDAEMMTLAFPSVTKETLLVGSLTREKGTSVGRYKIEQGTLRFNDDDVPTYLGKKLSDLFDLEIEEEYYRINERRITVTVAAGQSKVYGDADPTIEVTLSSGSLIYGDKLVCKITRKEGENVGSYKVTLSSAAVLTKEGGEDVSGNYIITLTDGTFSIEKRHLKVSPKAQGADEKKYYTDGFTVRLEVLDMSAGGRDVTDEYVTAPTGDRLSGKPEWVATEDPLVFTIAEGSLTVVNASKKSVRSNYQFDYVARAYTLSRKEIIVRIADGAVVTKYYGEKDPIISYTIDKTELAKLGDLTLADTCSIAREAGEDAGEYNLYAQSTEGETGGFRVMDAGKDVSKYFLFTVRNVVYGREKFTIKPRPITVTIEDETYENTGREIIPIIKYLNANGSRLSASVLATLKVTYGAPTMEYTDGENAVTPVVVGDVATDPNFEITVKAGTITLIYLQNRVTATPLAESEEIYKGRRYLLSGIMLYKTVKFYKLETANGEQPDREVEISLPIDETIKGDGLVLVALYADAASKAFGFTQVGSTLVYEDDGAYYVAIAEVQDWFYLIWGVVIIAAAVGIYFLVRLFIKIAKKAKLKKAAKQLDPTKAMLPKGEEGTRFEPSDEPAADAPAAEPSTDDMFSDEAESAPLTASPIGAEPTLSAENTDHLFTDALFTDSAPTLSETKSAESADILEEDVSSFDIPTMAPFVPAEKEVGKQKGKKSAKEEKKLAKEEKESKKKKKKTEFVEPKGFMPSSFKPKGDKSSAYAPTRSYRDDLFLDAEEEKADDSLLSDAAIPVDDSLILPTSSEEKGMGGDDELIIARSSGFADEEAEDGEDGDDGDMM